MKLKEKSNKNICEENKLKYAISTNIVEDVQSKNRIRATLEILAKTISGTLGPYGSTTIIEDREQRHFSSKDGYDLMNRINFQDEVSRTILNIVQKIASTQVLTVGDGSTSAIVVANALYSALTDDNNKKLFQKIAPKDIVDMLNFLSEYLEYEIKKLGRPVSQDLHELEKVAKIATNNDNEAGKLMREIYEKIGTFGFVSTDFTTNVEKDQFELTEGISWDRGYIDSYYGTGFENSKVVFEKEPAIFLTNKFLKFDDVENLILPIITDNCCKLKKELIIVANGYDEDVRTFLKTNRVKHMNPLKPTDELFYTAVDIANTSKDSKNTLYDLSVLAGCDIFDDSCNSTTDYYTSNGRFIGKIKKAIITEKSTQIITDNSLLDENRLNIKNKLIETLKSKIDELSKDQDTNLDLSMEAYETRKRYSHLTNSTATIKIGGKTSAERRTRERLFDDAIFACKSALKYGVIPGGNIIVPKILINNKDIIISKLKELFYYLPVENLNDFFTSFIDIIKNAFLESYKNVLDNSYMSEEEVENTVKKCLDENKFYNLKLHRFENFEDTEVINSTATDYQILKTVFSIIGILSTSNQFLTLNLYNEQYME